MRTDPSILTQIAPVLLDRSNESMLYFPQPKSTSCFLPQSIVSNRSDLSSGTNSSCLITLNHRCLITLRIESSIFNIDTNITDSIIRKFINVWQELGKHKDGALRNRLLWTKDKIKINSQPEIPYDMSFWKRPACQTPSKP